MGLKCVNQYTYNVHACMGRERQEPILSSTCKGMDNSVSREQTAAMNNFKQQAKSDGCLKAAAAAMSAPLKRSARVRARE
jgi:hypothetical protein